MLKKILMIIPTNTPGGAERVFAQLANYFVAQGIEIVYVNFDSSSSFYDLDDKVCSKKMNLEFKGTTKLSKLIEAPIIEMKRFLYIRKLIKTFKPDIVIPFLEVAELLTIPNCLLQKVPFCVSVRNDFNQYFRYMKILAKLTYRKAKIVVCQTECMKKTLLKAVKCNAIVIPNPIDESTYAREPFEGIRRKVIINVGRLTAQKNQKLLIAAFGNVVKKYTDYELHIFGKGELLSELQDYVNSLGLHSKVLFKGVEPNVLLNNRDAALFVMSSDFEGFPNTLVEAMANGIPVISTDFDTNAAKELLDDGNGGGLVPVGNMDSLEKEIIYVLDNPDIAARRVRKSLYVREYLNSKRICNQWLQEINNAYTVKKKIKTFSL